MNFCVNCGAQWVAISGASAVGNCSQIGPKVLLEPILGIGTSVQFVRATSSAIERRNRVVTLAAFISTSATSMFHTDPATNFAVGGSIASQISFMKAIIARGEAQETVKYVLIPSLKDFAITSNRLETPAMTRLLSPAQMQFNNKCNIITQNIFVEHTARRYVKGLAQKGRNLLTFSGPLIIQTPTKGSIASSIGYSFLGIGISIITIYGLLSMIRNAKKKHYEIVVKANERVIDVTSIDLD